MIFVLPRCVPLFLAALALGINNPHRAAAANANQHNLRGHQQNTNIPEFLLNQDTRRVLQDIDIISEGQSVACNDDVNHILRWTNGQLRHYPDPVVASSWDRNWRDFLRIDCANLDLPIGPEMTVTLKEGDSITCNGNEAEVFRWTNDQLRHYPDPAVASSWDRNWRDFVLRIDCANLDLPVGPEMIGINANTHYAGEETPLLRSASEALTSPSPAPFSINVTAAKDDSETRVWASGYQIMRLQDAPSGSAEAFGLGADQSTALRNAIATGTGWPSPDDAFLGNGYYTDVYTEFAANGFAEVMVSMEVIDSKVVSVTSTPVVVGDQTFQNDLDVPMTVHADISDSVTQSASSTWSSTQTAGFSEKVAVEIGFEGIGKASSETTLSFEETNGRSSTTSKSETIATSSGVSFDIAPHRSATVDLNAYRGILTVEVTYVQNLTGCIAIWYKDQYNKHWWWCIGATDVPVTFSQTIQVDYYSNTYIVAKDNSDGSVIFSSL